MSDRRGYSREGSRQNGSYEPRNVQRSDWGRESNHNNRWDNNTDVSTRRHTERGRSNDEQAQVGGSRVVRVSYDAVGCLTARGNAKIQELQDQTGTRIKVYHLTLLVLENNQFYL